MCPGGSLIGASVILLCLGADCCANVSLYSVDRAGVSDVVSALLTTEQLRVESAELVWRAKRRYEASKADFSDTLIADCVVAAGCKRAVTFDRTAAATSGFELLT